MSADPTRKIDRKFRTRFSISYRLLINNQTLCCCFISFGIVRCRDKCFPDGFAEYRRDCIANLNILLGLRTRKHEAVWERLQVSGLSD
jgi:hypothetical protein